MIPADLAAGQPLIVLGVAVVIFVFLIRRASLHSRKPANHRQSSRVTEVATAVERSAEAGVENPEVRIFDFAREVEAFMQTRIAVLDRLIVDADHEILRLQDLLEATKGTGRAGSLAGQLADPRPAELRNRENPSRRQADVILLRLPPPASGHRDAA